jgi:alpha-beta hydrolase superfamily lysophospholipase
MTVADIGADFTLAQYREREKLLFAETRAALESSIPLDERVPGNRYWKGSPNYPWNFPTDWNRSFERVPAQARGGALLLHGLTDSPYSLRAVANALFERGYYVLVLRLPGHGTVPASLERATWQDWLAATRLGARTVRAQIGPDLPFVMVGYSSGAALTIKHQLDALDDPALPRANRILLLSPMIGISPAAALSRVLDSLSFIPYFSKSAWTDVQPEFNPFKYNSFPLNGAIQTHALTAEIASSIERLKANGRLNRIPPILAFQSVLDATVRTTAVVRTLFDELPANGSELVVFDVNRLAGFSLAFKPEDRDFLRTLFTGEPRAYRLDIVTNASPNTREAVQKSVAPGTREIGEVPIGLEYPPGVYSLSHIAVPFPVNDPLYGLAPDESEFYGIRLGTLALHGERNALRVSLEQLARIGSNPFYPYLEQRALDWLDPGAPGLASTSVAVFAAKRPARATVTACDRLAAHPEDPDRVAPGVETRDVDLPGAIAACTADADKAAPGSPDYARLQYQLGRAWFYNKQTQRALPFLERAAAAGSEQAQFVLGYVIDAGLQGVTANPCEVEDLWVRSARAGRLAAQVTYPHHVLRGRFAGCRIQATPEEMRGFLKSAASRPDNNYYQGLLISVLQGELEASPAAAK